MPVTAIHPPPDIDALLPGAQFSDAFTIATHDATLDARHAAERMFARRPRWITVLMTLRDTIVAPLGLKTEKTARSARNRVGIFPVISETPQRIVAGLDDRHLDFRLIVDVASFGAQRRITATTVVLTHNLPGRCYLAMIMPFHRLIVRALLRHLA